LQLVHQRFELLDFSFGFAERTDDISASRQGLSLNAPAAVGERHQHLPLVGWIAPPDDEP
jgi:hypothetical protein